MNRLIVTKTIASERKEEMKFNIKEDLKHRPLKQQIEILWISGPTWHNAKMIAERLDVNIEIVRAVVGDL